MKSSIFMIAIALAMLIVPIGAQAGTTDWQKQSTTGLGVHDGNVIGIGAVEANDVLFANMGMNDPQAKMHIDQDRDSFALVDFDTFGAGIPFDEGVYVITLAKVIDNIGTTADIETLRSVPVMSGFTNETRYPTGNFSI